MSVAMAGTSTLLAGRYRLGEELGRGGMGVVWSAYDELLHRTVAVKEVHYPDGIDDDEREKLARRTLREARAVAAVEDPHAVRVFDIVEQDGRPWLVMELVAGRTLTDVVRDRGALSVAEVVQVGLALTQALSAAHRAGVLHRDVKPSNVLVRDDGRVALTDFGIATVDSDPSDLTTSGQLVGSPAYMAPERVRGERPSPASDVWSLGATLWTAAEGQPPYTADNAFATLAKVVNEDPPLCRRCTGAFGDLIAAMMAQDPAARPDLDEVANRLRQVDAVAAVPTEPYPTEELPPAFDRTVALDRPVDRTQTRAPDALPPPTPLPAAAPAAATRDRQSEPSRRRSVAPLAIALLLVVVVAAGVLAYVLSSHHSTPTAAKAQATPSATASHSSAASPSASTAAAGLPAGWTRYTDPSVRWSIGVPAGWRVDPSGSSVFFRDPAGGRYLQVDTKYPAGPSAKGAWEDQERAFRSSHSGYHRIALTDVSWRDYPDVADWEFTYSSGGASLHAVDRGAVVSNRGYGLFFQTHADQWDASQKLRQQFYASFQPAH